MTMYAILLSLLLIPTCYDVPPAMAQPQDMDAIITELDLTLDHFFLLLDDESLDTFIAGVRHASRAGLLLEQKLGEKLDDLNFDSSATEQEYVLKLIAKRVKDLSGEAGRELWRQDYEDKQWALLRLSELENLVKGLKKTH